MLDRCLYGLAGTRASVVSVALVRRALADLPKLGAEVEVGKSGGSRHRRAWVLAGLLAGTTATVAVASFGLAPQQVALSLHAGEAGVSSTSAPSNPATSAAQVVFRFH